MECTEHAVRRPRRRIDARGFGAFAVGLALLVVAVSPLRSVPVADHRSELQESLAQRYRLTVIGPGILGIRGGQQTIRKPGASQINLHAALTK
jgi:hypothetical protein